MYADPKHIKKHPYKVSLNDDQQRLIESAASAIGEQPSAYLRELAMEKLREILELNGNARAAG